MSHELRRVLLNEAHDSDGLIEVGLREWFDPYAAGLKSGPFEVLRENRAAVAHGTAQVRKASVVFLTLGLVEGWVDSVTGLAMNRAPTDRSLVLIINTCNPNMRFVLTVSPVPFHATFRAMDVVTTNTLSKSLLRTVVDDLAYRLDFVDYFSSYEIVVNRLRSISWMEDQIHVSSEMVAHVMSVFERLYLS
jgi:hypothetical protein